MFQKVEKSKVQAAHHRKPPRRMQLAGLARHGHSVFQVGEVAILLQGAWG